ncbi:hypothetical protein BDY21DRAFT_375197 [Lineolata rhizophorae]|uniref:Protein Zds1 C-terminal domain-containing protein n=1 Tax=Lineolata rhizophorae TaxID=578093 RepID=A0A6A6NNJ5_9PEZI|nr:hypothetical protein BDY21DRAFT_375197 [Lineolata rhizophorae]
MRGGAHRRPRSRPRVSPLAPSAKQPQPPRPKQQQREEDEKEQEQPTQTSARARELERMYQARRGHAHQISISDENHHVTEAIGDMYGDEHEYPPAPRAGLHHGGSGGPVGADSRPLSFVSTPSEHQVLSYFDPRHPPSQQQHQQQQQDQRSPPHTRQQRPQMQSSHSYGPRSPTQSKSQHHSPQQQHQPRQTPSHPLQQQSLSQSQPQSPQHQSQQSRAPLGRVASNERVPQPRLNGPSKEGLTVRSSSLGRENGQTSPPAISHSPSETATHQFPLNDIDYESSPAAVAQELSNLQAIRRMSMDVHASDPDLPSFGNNFSVPAVAPASNSDEDDASHLFWVPARLHPELAPTEFKTFIQDKMEKIRRRSGSEDSLSPDGVSHQSSSSGLRRKKSMLSRQINNPTGYQDGAERLERKRSLERSNSGPNSTNNLQELEHLVSDPSTLMRRLSIDAARKSLEGGGGAGAGGAEAGGTEDMPILPPKPAGHTLKRSTRTNYRRGSLRKGERVPMSKRVANRQAETDTEVSPVSSPVANAHDEGPSFGGLQRVRTEPMPQLQEPPENFSRPTRRARSPPMPTFQERQQQQTSSSSKPSDESTAPTAEPAEGRKSPPAKPFHSRIASNGRTTAPLPGYQPPQPVPQIIETPPPQEVPRQQISPPPPRSSSHAPPPSFQPPQQHQQAKQKTPSPPPPSPPGSSGSATSGRAPVSGAQQPGGPARATAPGTGASPQRPTSPGRANAKVTFEEIANQPSPLPVNSTRTDSLSFIPTLTEDKKGRNKEKDKKEEGGSRKTSWGWLLGGEDKEKRERERAEEREREKKARAKLSGKGAGAIAAATDAKGGHDSTRLDVLQGAIDGSGASASRGRESLVLDRESLKLEEERRKESSRKSGGSDGGAGAGGKKEKEAGIFSALFGGVKKSRSADRDRDGEGGHRKKRGGSGHDRGGGFDRGLSPEPPARILRPDVDYNWTRFSILEERAIYRMAHIKLANPRRELYSQVLLSNFMYSYLAKVQQMHPQIQIPQSAAQKQAQRQRKEEEDRRRDRERAMQREGGGAGGSATAPASEELSLFQRYQEQQAQQDAARDDAASPPKDDEGRSLALPGQEARGGGSGGGGGGATTAGPTAAGAGGAQANGVGGSGGYTVASGQSYLGGGAGGTGAGGKKAYYQQQQQRQDSFEEERKGDDEDEMW